MVLFIAEDHGVIHWETLPEPMTRELFSATIVRLRAKLDNNLTYKLIVDNLSSHKHLTAGTFQVRQLDARRAAIIATKDLPRGKKTSARVSIVTDVSPRACPC